MFMSASFYQDENIGIKKTSLPFTDIISIGAEGYTFRDTTLIYRYLTITTSVGSVITLSTHVTDSTGLSLL